MFLFRVCLHKFEQRFFFFLKNICIFSKCVCIKFLFAANDVPYIIVSPKHTSKYEELKNILSVQLCKDNFGTKEDPPISQE